MRIYEGDYAYEVERVRDPATQLVTGWRYNVYRIRPDQKLLRSGDRATQAEAESAARETLHSVMDAHQQIEGKKRSRAA